MWQCVRHVSCWLLVSIRRWIRGCFVSSFVENVTNERDNYVPMGKEAKNWCRERARLHKHMLGEAAAEAVVTNVSTDPHGDHLAATNAFSRQVFRSGADKRRGGATQ